MNLAGVKSKLARRFHENCLLAREELLDHRSLARLLQQKTVMSVRSLDDVELDLLASRAERARELLGTRRRVEPIGAERDEQRSGRHVADRGRELSAAVLPRGVGVGQRAGRVEIRVGVEASHERIRLVAQVTLDLELGLGEEVANVVRELQPPPELVVERRGGEIR